MLFLREIKKTMLSVSYLILIFVMVVMCQTQGVLSFSEDEKLTKPVEGQNYGMYGPGKEIPEIIMPAALNSLYQEFLSNNYIAYPIGFYKNVKLNEKKQRQMAAVLSELTGLEVSAFTESSPETNIKNKENTLTIDGNANISEDENGNFSITVPEKTDTEVPEKPGSVSLREDISYEQFRKCMRDADDLIGGGSYYSNTYLISQFGAVPVTYEEALEQYELTQEVDKFTGGYARLFSDYALTGGLGILPVLLAVVMCLKDRRAKMSELIYERKISSLKLIFTRYFAMLFSILIPIIILSYISNISVWNWYDKGTIDYLAALKYDLGWIMPTVMMAAAVGMFFTELTGTPIAIIIQGLWWFIDMNLGVNNIFGGLSLFSLSPRHNSICYTERLLDYWNTLVANRVLFAAVSLILVMGTAVIYELKRRGVFGGTSKMESIIERFRDRKSKSAA